MNFTPRLAAWLLPPAMLAGFIPSAFSQTETIVDNGSPGFSTIGTWPVSTAVGGYYGANYQTHAPNGPSPSAVTVDNTDAGFSVTGTWPTSAAIPGYLGANYRVHAPNGEPPSAIVVDNAQGAATGTWSGSTAIAGYYGANYQVHAAGTGASTFTWPMSIPGTGTYRVYARWTQHSNRATNAKYTVNHASGADVVTVNQETGGGTWNLLGTYTLNAGSTTVVLSDDANENVIADAVMVVPEGAAPNTATWTISVPGAGSYQVYARWTQHPNRATNAAYTVNHASGSTVVTVNQEAGGGAWALLGTYTLNAGQTTVSLTDQGDGYVIADAVMIVPPGASPNTATWTPNVSQAGTYQVYARWTANPNRATDAKYTLVHASGTSTVTVNQQANGGVWNLFGSYVLQSGIAHKVSLSDQANGFVIADAIRLVSANVAPAVAITSPANNTVVNAPANVTLTASASDADGSVTKVDFYQGATLIGTATSAPYSVTATGLAVGSHSFSAVATDNQGATTTSTALNVVVNALPSVAITSPANNANVNASASVAVTINAQDPDGTLQRVELYANNALIATLTSAPYSFNWMNVGVGTYSLTAKAIDNNNAETVSAAVSITVRSVNNLFFIHVDHLNTPRLIADANQTAVWKWEQAEPFGASPPNEDPDGNTVAFELPLRFPGQYADKETGLNYNYFRDYDPGVGRYVESDPIGLAGGINTYAYVEGGPLWAFDGLGLKLCLVDLPGIGKVYLDDAFVPRVMDFLQKNREAGIDVVVTSAFRDSGKQAGLSGDPSATTPAPVGASLHEAGFAIDISLRALPSKQSLPKVVQNARSSGMSWGGKFRKPDPVHFYTEVPGGLKARQQKIRDAQEQYKKGAEACKICP